MLHHLVNISSIAEIRGSGSAPAYNASKAFESIYMDGLRNKIAKLDVPITITDIQPGAVDLWKSVVITFSKRTNYTKSGTTERRKK
jgi:NADP-dependent 3-hydroxy acid dehydrogenase YdfG